MSLWAVLLTELFAGGASCAAVQGGLLAGTVARRQPEPATVGPGQPRLPAASPDRKNDAVPVGAFLAGKLAANVLLGAALGLAGSAVQFSPSVRAFMQIVAGTLMLLLALNLFGVTAVRGLVQGRGPVGVDTVHGCRGAQQLIDDVQPAALGRHPQRGDPLALRGLGGEQGGDVASRRGLNEVSCPGR
jgi:hypothetical protein